jgi:hypothetical protein
MRRGAADATAKGSRARFRVFRVTNVPSSFVVVGDGAARLLDDENSSQKKPPPFASRIRSTLGTLLRSRSPGVTRSDAAPLTIDSAQRYPIARDLTGLEEEHRDLTEVKVDEVLRLVRDVGAEVAADDAVPGGVVLLVELLLDERGDVLLDVVLLESLRKTEEREERGYVRG